MSRQPAYLFENLFDGSHIYLSMEGLNEHSARCFIGADGLLKRVAISDAKRERYTVSFYTTEGTLIVSLLPGTSSIWHGQECQQFYPLEALNIAFHKINESDKGTTVTLKGTS